jgi:23S rRNA (uracil1939-C5)-methyltransferase
MVQFYKAPSSGSARRKKQNAGMASIPSIYIDTLDHHGNGVALKSKPIIVIEGALPGETLSARVSSDSKNVQRAKATKIITPSDKRIKAKCEVFEECGGCNLQHLSAQDGLEYKGDALKRYFSSLLMLDDEVWQPPIVSDIDYSAEQKDIGYRRKVRFALDARQKDKVKIGYRQAQSNKVVDIKTCPILHKRLAQKVEVLLPALKSLWCVQKIGHFECVLTNDGVVLMIHFAKALNSETFGAFEHISVDARVRVICQFKERLLFDSGEAHARLSIEDIPGLALNIGPQHFIQVNGAVNRKMIEQAISWLAPKPDSIVHDFFCGLGNFSIALAPHCAKVVGYEVVDSMVAQANLNAKANIKSVLSTRFETMDLSSQQALASLNILSSDLVLLDPARDGAAALCEHLIRQKPQRIVYVSCNPNTLVRDLKILSTDFTIKAISSIDMFPFTQHIESMALLERI